MIKKTNPLIKEDTAGTLREISESMAALQGLLKQKDTEALSELATSTENIKEAINYETERVSKRQAKKTYKDWLDAMPIQLPDYLDHSNGPSLFQNPLIGEQQTDTYRQIRQIMEFFVAMASPIYPGTADLSLNEDEALGLIAVLQCVSGALGFEEKHREHGGIPTE